VVSWLSAAIDSCTEWGKAGRFYIAALGGDEAGITRRVVPNGKIRRKELWKN